VDAIWVVMLPDTLNVENTVQLVAVALVQLEDDVDVAVSVSGPLGVGS
jgi:hypothetical protein